MIGDTSTDLQAVVLAGGRGSRITQLIGDRPKCLLSIANRPVIAYVLEMLIRGGFKDALMIVLDSEEETIKSAVSALQLEIQVEYRSIPANKDYATADSLRLCRDRIHKDFLVVSCDVVSDLNLKNVIQHYRLHQPTFLCLLSAFSSEKENLVPAKKLKVDNQEFDYIGLDREHDNRLVFFESDVMYTDEMILNVSFLEKCPHISMSTRLADAHVYIFKRWVLDFLDFKKNIKSIKGEFVPSIVRKQFRRHHTHDADETVNGERGFFDFVNTSEFEDLLQILNGIEDGLPEPKKEYPNSAVTCQALILDTGYCVRANTWLGFCEANRILLRQKSGKDHKVARSDSVRSYVDGLVGLGSEIGEKCTVKRSIIGSNCRLGDRVKLTNCIVQDGVILEEECHLQNSVLCHHTVVGNRAEIKDCIVGPSQKIVPFGSHSNESLMEAMMDF